MTTATKAVTYTSEMTVNLLAGFAAGMTVEALATEMGKSVSSIVAKLSREGVYKAKAKTAKAEGKTQVAKAEMAAKIGELCHLSDADVVNVTKMTRQILVNILAKLESVPA